MADDSLAEMCLVCGEGERSSPLSANGEAVLGPKHGRSSLVTLASGFGFSPIQPNTLQPCTSASAVRMVCALSAKTLRGIKKSALKIIKLGCVLLLDMKPCALVSGAWRLPGDSCCHSWMQLRHDVSKTLFWDHSHALQMVMGFF